MSVIDALALLALLIALGACVFAVIAGALELYWWGRARSRRRALRRDRLARTRDARR